MHNHIRHALGKGKNTSLIRLIAPAPNTTSGNLHQIFTSKDGIHDKIISHSIQHYSKAESSPLGISKDLYHKIGLHGTSSFCYDILNGNIHIKDLNTIPMKETIELLQSAMKPQMPSQDNSTSLHPSQISIELDKTDYTNVFQRWKETTTTSPSGLYSGHYKAILKCPEIVKYHCIMASLPLKYGFASTQWTKAVQIMLENKPGNP